MKKICSICKIEKDKDEFYKFSKSKDGLQTYCKQCSLIKSKEYVDRVRQRSKKIDSFEKICYKCKIKKSIDLFSKDKTKSSGYSTTCKECNKLISKKFREDNPEYTKIYNQSYYENNKDYIKRYTRKYRLENIESIRKNSSKYESKRMKIDLNYKLRRYLRDNIRKTVMKNGSTKKSKTLDLLGCNIEEFKVYITTKFQNGMNWDNYGKWHLDHIKPCAAFDLTDIIEQKICFHFTNYQPLWAIDNIKKNSYYKGKRYRYDRN